MSDLKFKFISIVKPKNLKLFNCKMDFLLKKIVHENSLFNLRKMTKKIYLKGFTVNYIVSIH